MRKAVIIYIWKVANDPTIAQTKVDLMSIPFLVLPELCWYIYGNTLIWNENTMNSCKQDNPLFFWSVVVLLAYGYLFMLGFFLMILAALALCCYFRMNQSKPEEEGTQKQAKSKTRMNIEQNAMRIQDLSFLSEISKFQARKNKGLALYTESILTKSRRSNSEIQDCGLCYLRLVPIDNVVDCEGGHVFHETCFAKQEMHAHQNVCPRCGKQMTLSPNS